MGLALGFGAHEHSGDPLVGADVDQVVDRHPLRLSLPLRHLVHPQLEHTPALRKEKHRGVGVRRQQVKCVVLLTSATGRLAPGGRSRPLQSDASALLRAKDAQRLPLHVTAVGQCHYDFLFEHEVLSGELGSLLPGDLGPAVIAVFLDQLVHVFLDQEPHLLVAGQDAFQVGDRLDHLLVLLIDLAALQPSQAAEGQSQHRLRLALAQTELRLQLSRRHVLVGGGADRLDHLVEVVEADLEALEDVRPLLRPLEVVPRTPQDHVAPVIDEQLERLLQTEHDRAAVDDREHDHAECRLQSGVLVEVVQHGEHLRLSLELDHDAHAVAVGFVAQIGDALELALGDELGDLGHQGGLVDRVWQLVDDDAFAAVRRLLERVTRADDDAAVAGRIGRLDAGRAHDDATGRKVGTLDEGQQVLGGRFRIVDQVLDAGGDLTQVMRRDVGGHSDRDPGGAVDEQVGHTGREHRRLLFGAVVVRPHVDGLLLDVRHQLAGDR